MQKNNIIGFIFTATILGFIIYKLDFVQLYNTFRQYNFKYLLLIVPIYILTLYLRGIRWKILLLEDKKYSSLNLSKVFTVGSMLNVFLPARAGDIYRAYYLGKTNNDNKMKIFGSIILERTFDGICMYFILLSAIIFYCKKQWIINFSFTIGGIFIGSLLIFYLTLKFNKIDFLCDKLSFLANKLPDKISSLTIRIINKTRGFLQSFICGFSTLNSLKYTSTSFFWSIIIWLLETYIVHLILLSFNLGIGFSAALFVISLTSFSTMLPSTSIFLGPYQAAYILALKIYNINSSSAIAISTIHQSIIMMILTILGGYFFYKFKLSLNETKNLN